jgi:zinc transport system substrate-binding protein
MPRGLDLPIIDWGRVAVMTTLGMVLSLLTATVGCEREPSQVHRPPLNINCSVYPYVEVAAAVGGQRVRVAWLIEAGQPIFNWRPGTEQLARWQAADLAVTTGRAEPWAIQGLADPYRAAGVILLDSLPAAAGQAPDTYLWLDPQVVRELADLLRQRLTVLEVQSERYFQENAEAYVRRIDELEQELAPRLEGLRGRKVLALHGRWNPLTRLAGLEVVQPVSAAAHALSGRDWSSLRRAVQEHGLEVLLIEADTAPAVVRELEQRLGVRALLLDPLGTSAPAGRNGYLAIMRYNLEQLAGAWD